MKYITDINDIRETEFSVVTLGKFDGLHRGHQKIFKRAREIAATYDCNFSVFTFSVSPQTVLGQSPYRSLMSSSERRDLIEEAGADLLAECPFNEALMNMEAEDFITEILLGKMRAKAVITGKDFRFGKNRAGDTALLRALAAEYGFYAEAVEKTKDGSREISSSYIREEVEAGRMENAARLLGYDYFLKGRVCEGRKLGRTIGFPTANLVPDPVKILPPYGVYSSRTKIGGVHYKSITDIGTKPTVDGTALGAETYICGFDGDIYGQEIRVSLQHYMRGERKFGSVAELEEQIKKDIKERENYEN